MAFGTWDDFVSKYGFSDGEVVERRDFRARDQLCQLLNALPALGEHQLLAVPWDRSDGHNPCMILIFENPDRRSPDELKQAMVNGQLTTTTIPDAVLYPEGEGDEGIHEWIVQAYEEADGPASGNSPGCRQVLEEFVVDVETATVDHVLNDLDWSDLLVTYGKACRVLGRHPYIATAEEEER